MDVDRPAAPQVTQMGEARGPALAGGGGGLANQRQTPGAGPSGVSDGGNAGVKRRGIQNDSQEAFSRGSKSGRTTYDSVEDSEGRRLVRVRALLMLEGRS